MRLLPNEPGLSLLLAAFAASVAPSASSAPIAPHVQIGSLKQLPTPLPSPYDARADANAQVVAAYARAKSAGKRLLVDFGGNWCPDCRILAGVMALPEVKPFIEEHFEVVSVDVGMFNKNMDVVKGMKIPKLAAVPWIVIVEPDSAIVVSSYEITDEHHRTPQSMVDWLAKWTK